MSDKSLKPIPCHVKLWVAMITRPLLASAIVGLPFGLVMYWLAINGISVVDLMPDWYSLLAGWLSVSLVMYIRLTNPY